MLDAHYLKNLRKISRLERRKIFTLLKVFKELERSIDEFQRASNLHCVAGCGRCCENPQIESSVVEMLPLAFYFADKISGGLPAEQPQKDRDSVCRFYRPDSLVPGHGRCSVYPLRPLVCRLFGFSSRDDKQGRPEIVTCSTIKTQFPKDLQKAQDLLKKGFPVPKMSDYSMKLYSIDPRLATERLPINEAFEKALEKVLLMTQYSSYRRDVRRKTF